MVDDLVEFEFVIDRPKPPHTLESSFLQDSLQSMVLRWMVAPKELSRPVLTQRLLLHHQGDVLQQVLPIG